MIGAFSILEPNNFFVKAYLFPVILRQLRKAESVTTFSELLFIPIASATLSISSKKIYIGAVGTAGPIVIYIHIL
jgi:hypothetical protein